MLDVKMFCDAVDCGAQLDHNGRILSIKTAVSARDLHFCANCWAQIGPVLEKLTNEKIETGNVVAVGSTNSGAGYSGAHDEPEGNETDSANDGPSGVIAFPTDRSR